MMTSANTESPGATRRVLGGVAAFVVLSALVGLLLSGASYKTAPSGLPDAGPVVGRGLPILSGLTFVAAFATIGWLLYASFLDTARVEELGVDPVRAELEGIDAALLLSGHGEPWTGGPRAAVEQARASGTS